MGLEDYLGAHEKYNISSAGKWTSYLSVHVPVIKLNHFSKQNKSLAYILLCVNFQFLIITRDALIQFWKLRQEMAFAVGYSPVWSWCMIAKYGASFKVFAYLNSLSTFHVAYKFLRMRKAVCQNNRREDVWLQIYILMFRNSKCKPGTTVTF